MSNSKSAIQEIKSLMVQFGFLKNEEAVKEIFLDAKLVDGTEIKVEGDSLIEGAKVFVVTAEGEIIAPDAVHELSDGTKVETKEGLIVRIEKVVAEELEVEKPEAEVEIEVSKEGIEKEMVDMLKEFIYKMGDKVKKMEEQMSTLSSDFSSFKKEPAAKKIADGKTEKFNKMDEAIDSKLEAIAALRKTNK
jgi:preprotein translocase subunit YajC